MPLSSVVGAQSIVKPGVCTSSTKPASPFDGQVIYMTDADQTAVWDGSSWVGLERSRDRNVIINGAMQVAQRGTSTASITGDGYFTADRWRDSLSSLGTWTQSVENDAPTGSGFRKSLKMLCTTANASPSAGAYNVFSQKLEGQNIQQFAKGTASAKQFAVSFWVKSNVTGTYVLEIYDMDNNRQVSASYTVSSSATWEKKTIIFPADTTGAFDNDNAQSLEFNFWLGAGTTYTSGTLNTTWASATSATRAVGQTNLASATNNYWQVTGVQLEAGAVATPFEFEDYETTLAKCQRYYQRIAPGLANGSFGGFGAAGSTTGADFDFVLPVQMRATPTSIDVSGQTHFQGHTSNLGYPATSISIQAATANKSVMSISLGGMSTTAGLSMRLLANNNANAYLGFSAEL
jgi:hypothetical protein